MNPGQQRFARAAVTIAVGLSSLACLPGCSKDPESGWAMTSTHDDRFQTISIPIFQNDTWFRGLERELGRSLVVEMESRTPYKVTGQGTADTLLRGRIRSAELILLSSSVTTGLADEMLLKSELDFEWVDL
ncbi:MAG: hypothetical protein GY885_17845, partial [Phycisphaeraceae bacterium]|nr:hypothetical protein [Phycisphaeraceae bacterium]